MNSTPETSLEQLVRGQLPNGTTSSVATAQKLIREHVIDSPSGTRFHATDNDPWDQTHSRSDLRWLHGFVFIGDWVRAWETLDEADRAALTQGADGIVSSWRHRYTFPSDRSSMAFHDETTALRLRSLLAARLSQIGNHISSLDEIINETSELLEWDDFYAGLNNHGMFQDGALLTLGAASRLTRLNKLSHPATQKAWNRIIEYGLFAFGADGVHGEHSPSYHLLVSTKIAQYQKFAEALQLEHKDALNGVLDKAAEFATHSLTPTGHFVPFGDTSRIEPPLNQIRTLASEELLWAATHTKGTPPKERIATFIDSGYATFRTSWADRDAIYAAVANAYNGSYHKHSDELNVYLEASGVPILDDAGPYGYDYGDPLVTYAFSSHAHNTLLVDGNGLERHDENMIGTSLVDTGSTDEVLRTKASTTRFSGVRAHREVVISGTSTHDFKLNIEDSVSSDDSHQYTYMWHIGPDITPILRGSAVELFHGRDKFAEIYITSDTAHRISLHEGTISPLPRGLQFPRMGKVRKATVIHVDSFGNSARISTEVRTGGFKLAARGVTPGSEWRISNGSVPLRYMLDRGSDPESLAVVFSSIRSKGDFTYDYKSTLDGVNVARLYILDDFGEQGCYYYSNNREPRVFTAVQALIHSVARNLGFSMSDVTLAGSSKGGTAALIHGYAANAGRIIVGAPQTAIGSFAKSHHPDILRYMSGGIGEGDRLWANTILSDALKDASTNTRVSILVGDADHHLKGHIRPFMEVAHAEGKPLSVATLPGIDNKSIGSIYRDFLRAAFKSDGSALALPHVVRIEASGDRLTLALGGLVNGFQAACYLYRDGEAIEKSQYSSDATRSWDVAPGHEYFVRVFVRYEQGEPHKFNTQILSTKEACGPTTS